MLVYGNDTIDTIEPYQKGYSSACNSIRELLVLMRERLDDEEAIKELDRVLDDIRRMNKLNLRPPLPDFMGSEC